MLLFQHYFKKRAEKLCELWLLERFPGKLLHNSDAGPGGSGPGGSGPGGLRAGVPSEGPSEVSVGGARTGEPRYRL